MPKLFVIVNCEPATKTFELPEEWEGMTVEEKREFEKKCRKLAIREAVEVHLLYS